MSSNFEEICTTGKGTIRTYQSVADEFKGSYPTATEIQYKRTMEREGKTLTTYTGGTEFKAFFRITNDNANQRETVCIYYDVTAPVRPGTLIMYGYGVYLALNRETVENDVYYKSTLIKCNGVYNANNGAVMNIPFYSDNMKSSVSVGNSVITTLGGNVELITEENSLSKKIAIDQKFNEFGRTFQVTNLYSMDGILHIIGEVTYNETPTYSYTVKIDGTPGTSVEPGTTVQLSATPYLNGVITTGATFDWTSSNNAVATVNGTGLVTCLTEGAVTITCTWTEQNVNATTSITIGNTVTPDPDTPVTPTYSYAISGNTKLRFGFERTYTFIVKDSSGNTVDDVECTWNVATNFVINQEVNGNKIVLMTEDEDAIDYTFPLQALVGGVVVAEITITVADLM